MDRRIESKHDDRVILEVTLSTDRGEALSDFPLLLHDPLDRYRNQLYETDSRTDAEGMIRQSLQLNPWRSPHMPTTLALLSKRKPARLIRRTFYLPTLHVYGEYEVMLALALPNQEEWELLSADRPRRVPPNIPANRGGGIDQPNTEVHGASYYSYGGQINYTMVIANGRDTRLVPMSSRGDRPIVRKIDVPSDPRLSVTAEVETVPEDPHTRVVRVDLVIPATALGK